jgi:sugar phosphate permease
MYESDFGNQEDSVDDIPPSTVNTQLLRFLLRDPQPEISLTIWQVFRTQAFWLMALTFAIWAAMPGIVTVHIGPFLAEELNVSYVVAVSALSFFAATSLIGRIGFGFLADYVNVRALLASLLVMQGVGLFLFSHVQTLAQVPLYVIVFSIPYGGTLPLRHVLQGYLFGRRQFGTIGGFLQFVDLPATASAPVWIGFLADNFTGGYRIGFQILAGMLVIAALAVLLIHRPRPPLPTDQPPTFISALRWGNHHGKSPL